MADQVLVEVKDRVMWIRMNRPEKKNALTGAMYHAMSEALTQSATDAAVRAVLIAGTQDCFTAGNDLVDFANAKPGGPAPAMTFLQAISTAAKPVIAAVSGVAVGIGTTMLLHCDLVYAGVSAKFHLPFVNLGLCAEGGSSLILPAMLGQHRAAELLLFGEPFGPETAKEFGIVNQIFPEAELWASAGAKAQQLAEKPPAAMRATKALLKSHTSATLAETMQREGKQFGELLQGPEAREAMMAFMERRKPDFSKF
jgi:enoyl-CoA hydratase/carnithine racemase